MNLIAYHSNLYFDAFQIHVNEMKSKGFTHILFCITETDLLYNLECFQEFKNYAESRHMQCWATFWGLTAGEAICKKCNVEEWLKSVRKIGFEHILIDEPKSIKDVEKFLIWSSFFFFHVCFSDDIFNVLTDEEIRNLPVDSVAVSNYHWTKDWYKILLRSQSIAARLKRLRPDDNFIFLQGFDIEPGYELLPLIVKEVCEINGIKDFAFWCFRCEATAAKRPKNRRHIWNSINFNQVT